jgi:hypothetical protein
MITLRYVDAPGKMGRTLKYKTLVGAQERAQKLVGAHPKRDPDGYAVGPNGHCLFFQGATFEVLFPTEQVCGLT